MRWLSMGDPHKPTLLLVPPPPFGSALFLPLARALEDRFRIQFPERTAAPVLQDVVDALRRAAPRPTFVVLAGFSGPFLLPGVAGVADHVAGAILLGGPITGRRARASDFSTWYARQRSVLARLDDEDRLVLLSHRLGSGPAASNPDRLSFSVDSGGAPALAALDAALDGTIGDGLEGPCDLPLLVVLGGADRTLEAQGAGREIAETFPDVRTAILPTAGHLAALEATDMVASLIVTFVREPIESWPQRPE